VNDQTKTPDAGADKAKADTPKPAKADTPKAFDAKANKARSVAERALRAAGEKLPAEKRFTVAPGHTVRKGGERYTEGEAVDLSAADAERLLHKGVVKAGKASE
jgi:hypothetical protein